MPPGAGRSRPARRDRPRTKSPKSMLSAQMYAPDLPDPDLLIRTAGEMRISNFLLWGIAYSEIWVTPTLWPDFTPALLDGRAGRLSAARPQVRRGRA